MMPDSMFTANLIILTFQIMKLLPGYYHLMRPPIYFVIWSCVANDITEAHAKEKALEYSKYLNICLHLYILQNTLPL